MASAASSAFTFSDSPAAPPATGETTGRRLALHNARRTDTLTARGTPTRPMPGTGRACSSAASRPETPTAGRPAAVSPAASDLLTTPDNTISTTSIAAGDVDRRQ